MVSTGLPTTFSPASPSPGEIFDAGVKRGHEEMEKEHALRNNRRPGVIDDLRELLATGDIVIRRVRNGFIVRRIPSFPGYAVETWVVEGGDIKAVGDQLTAIQANDAMTPEVDRSAGNLSNGVSAMANSAAKHLANTVDASLFKSFIP